MKSVSKAISAVVAVLAILQVADASLIPRTAAGYIGLVAAALVAFNATYWPTNKAE